MKPPVESYPFQGVDLDAWPYGINDTSLRGRRNACFVSLDVKYAGRFTPFGTPVAQLVRMDGAGLLASKCGYCQEWLSRGACRCNNGPTSNVDDYTSEREPEA